MTPLERAARAMYDNVKPDWDWDDPDAELLRTMYRENARAAIEAIREPSENMIVEGADEAFGLSLRQVGVWQRMIDAMLEDG